MQKLAKAEEEAAMERQKKLRISEMAHAQVEELAQVYSQACLYSLQAYGLQEPSNTVLLSCPGILSPNAWHTVPECLAYGPRMCGIRSPNAWHTIPL